MKARGFTLVELLIALSVMALLAVLSWSALDGMVRARSYTQTHTDEVLTLQAGLAQWGADLDAMLDLQELPALDWDGRVLRVVRASGDGDTSGPRIAAWTRRASGGPTQWLRWQSPVLHSRAELLQAWAQAAQWGQNAGTSDQVREAAIVPLADWRIFYHRGGAWTNPLSSGDTQPTGGEIAPPDGVRLVLELPPGGAFAGTLTRDWVRPTAGGGKS